MAVLIKNIIKPSFSIAGSKGDYFPLKGACIQLTQPNPNCPVYIDDQYTEIVLEQNDNIPILTPCDRKTAEIDIYIAKTIVAFDPQTKSLSITIWGSSYNFLVKINGAVFTATSGQTITVVINQSIINSTQVIEISDERGPRIVNAKTSSTKLVSVITGKGTNILFEKTPNKTITFNLDA